MRRSRARNDVKRVAVAYGSLSDEDEAKSQDI